MNNNTLDFRGNTPPIDTNNPDNNVFLRQLRLASLFRGSSTGMLAVMGPCAMTEDLETLVRESVMIHQFEEANPGVTALHRLPFWKPRTDPLDWHGLITSHPELAIDIMRFKERFFGDLASELGSEEQIASFGRKLALGWVGSRNFEGNDLAEISLKKNWFMPLGIKNDMTGDIESMMDRIKHLRSLFPRSTIVPIFRGGESLDNPKKWEEAFKRLFDRTNGLFIVDSAHGTEIAHDKRFKKSVEGQLKALHHIKELRIAGFICRGLMVEMSDAISRTDPNIPFDSGLSVVIEIIRIK